MTGNMFGTDLSAPVSVIVTVEGAFNAGGRMLMGWASDWVGRRRTFLFVITLQIVIVSCLIFVIPQRTFWPFVVLVWLATLCYGGGVGVIAATLADMFGALNMPACHGVILTGWSVAAIGGGLTYTGVVTFLTKHKGYTMSDPYVYVLNQYWILSLLICGWIALVLIRITPRERMFPRVHGEIFHHSFAGVMVRLARGSQQNGLHDYEFLSAAPGLSNFDAGDNEADLESNDSKSEKMMDVNLNPPTTRIQSNTDINVLPNIHDTATISTYRLEDAQVGSKQPFASEAFNYVAQDATSIHSAVDTRISCVQLMCAMPPDRRCLKLFGKWRLELVPSAEVITVWRMYLSCALLASSDGKH
ncbi:hypothetical protein FBU31_005396 [Coemansia sp. 'formosensis']|nr:hypothetical protein FBU31_005396 [Coemansia sp. 'formosensis']